MPRHGRAKSDIGVYHVILCGANRQQIFADADDCNKLLAILAEYKNICGYSLYAYCLMGDHVHLLLKEGDESLEKIFKRVCGKFVYWYNTKNQRIGHVFHDRFKSEPVDSQEDLHTLIRYIHQNPIKAKLCNRVSDYKYSSYAAYLEGSDLIDTAYILQHWSLDNFRKQNDITVEKAYLDISEKSVCRVTDEQARVLMQKICNCRTAEEFQGLGDINQGRYLKKLRENGVSVRQLSRLTGVGYSFIKKSH